MNELEGRVRLPRVFQEQLLRHLKKVCEAEAINIEEFCGDPIHVRVREIDFWPSTHRTYDRARFSLVHGLEKFWKLAALPERHRPTNPNLFRVYGKKARYRRFRELDLFGVDEPQEEKTILKGLQND